MSLHTCIILSALNTKGNILLCFNFMQWKLWFFKLPNTKSFVKLVCKTIWVIFWIYKSHMTLFVRLRAICNSQIILPCPFQLSKLMCIYKYIKICCMKTHCKRFDKLCEGCESLHRVRFSPNSYISRHDSRLWWPFFHIAIYTPKCNVFLNAKNIGLNNNS